MTDTKVVGKTLMVVLHLDWFRSPEHLLRHATLDGAPNVVAELYTMGMYKKVGTVMCSDLNAAFNLTQNTDRHSWTQNRGVGPVDDQPGGYRSTSVGDIIVLDNQPYVIRGVGFDPIPVVLTTEHKTTD